MPDTTLPAPLAERITIATAVKEGLKATLPTRTRAAVIEHYAKLEADKQANALIKGMDKLTELERERYKIKPTFAGFNAAGEPVGEALFSKEQLDQLKKLNEQIEKLTKAIDKADEKADFSDLYNLAK